MLELNNIQEKNELRRMIEHYLLEIIIKKKEETTGKTKTIDEITPDEKNIEVNNTNNKFESFDYKIKTNDDKNKIRKIKASILPSLTNEYFDAEASDNKKLKKLSYDLADTVYLKEDNEMTWEKFMEKNMKKIMQIPTVLDPGENKEISQKLNPDNREEKLEDDKILEFIQKRKNNKNRTPLENSEVRDNINTNYKNNPIQLFVGDSTEEDPTIKFNPFYITKLNTSINDEIERLRDQYHEISYFMDSSFYVKRFEKEPELKFLELKEISKLAYEYKMFKYNCINNAIQFLDQNPNFEYNEKTEEINYKRDVPPLSNIELDNMIEKIKNTKDYFWNDDLMKKIDDSDIHFTNSFYHAFLHKAPSPPNPRQLISNTTIKISKNDSTHVSKPQDIASKKVTWGDEI